MSKNYLTNPEAQKFFEWQENQRGREDLPDYCLKTLNRVRRNAQKLERQVKGSNGYQDTLRRLRADKDKFFRQLRAMPKRDFGVKDLKEILPPMKMINCTHYTLDSWIRSQGGNRENYMARQTPYSLADFQDSTLEQCGVSVTEDGEVDYGSFSRDAIFRTVVIDEEYYAWLEKTGKVDEEPNRIAYINSVSDADADRLLHKNRLDVTYTICVIPVVVFYDLGTPPLTRWELSQNTKNLIFACLSRIFGEANVYFPGIIGKTDDIFNAQEEILEQTARYFNEGVMAKQYKNTEQRHKGVSNAAMGAIPFVIRYVHESASIPIREIVEEEEVFPLRLQNLYPDLIDFDYSKDGEDEDWEEEDSASCLPTKVSLLDEGISEAIQNDIRRPGVDPLDTGTWILADELPEFVEEMQEFFRTGRFPVRDTDSYHLIPVGNLTKK